MQRELQLYMYSGIREDILRRHDFYVEQVRHRVFAQFRDVEGEAETFADSEYSRIGSTPGSDGIDMGDVGEWAIERGTERYELLQGLRMQVLLGALAGLYHQWEKDLRNFIERELSHDLKYEDAIKIAWADPKVKSLFEILMQFGWDVSSNDFSEGIEASRLIVNVYKHGKGPSLEKLAKLHPEYLKGPYGILDVTAARSGDSLDHEDLVITEAQFEALVADFRKFWEEIPERLFLRVDQ